MKEKSGMACERVEALLGAYVDGELNRAQTAAVEAHLGGCPACARRLAELKELSALVADATAGEPLPPTLHASVMRVVSSERPAQVRTRRAPRWRRWSTVLACCICLVVVVLALIAGGGDKMMMEGIFDSNTMAPDAAYPSNDKSESVSDGDYGDYQGPLTPDAPDAPDAPLMPDAPDEPMAPMEPSLPDLPTADEAQVSYELQRLDGATAGELDGEWIGETVRLTFVESTGEVKVSYSGQSEARLATYTVRGDVLTLQYDDGDVESFYVICEEGKLWLTRR